jgi:RecJ-like exonuclease
MCNYSGYEFGAGNYPDSVCIDGKLYDADDCDDEGNLYEPGEDIPCPMCEPKGAVKYWAARNRCGGSSQRAASRNARSLVADIRANRGVHNMIDVS